jgi:hypothetical protein
MTKNSTCYGTTCYHRLKRYIDGLEIKNQKHLQDINTFLTSLKPSGILKVKGPKKAVFLRRKLNIQ